MFEFSKNRTDEFNEFLKKRNLADEDSPYFGINKNFINLFSDVPSKTGQSKPIILFSLMPKYRNEEKVHLPANEFKIGCNKMHRATNLIHLCLYFM